MTGSWGTVNFASLNLNVSLDFVSGNIKILGKQFTVPLGTSH